MPHTVTEIMTSNPVTLSDQSTLLEAAEAMQRGDIGDVIVENKSGFCGIVTDRDLVVRGLAAGKDPSATKIADVCTKSPQTVKADDSVDEAVKLMRQHKVRRLPVMQHGQVVGVVSLGDLAIDRDPNSALGEISKAPPRQ